jgi:ABC-type multidrug transport system ATPase subunit
LKRSIELRAVDFGYRRDVPIFRRLNLSIGPGLTLVLGVNGSGKSTLLRLVAGIERPDRGTVEVNGLDLWAREVAARTDLAYLPEEPDITPFASIHEVLRLVCSIRKEPLERGLEVLAEVGLSDSAALSIRELSKGQRRRVLLAATMIGSPGILLLDEPLDGMDREVRRLVMTRIRDLCQSGGLVMAVTHELEPFLELPGRAVALLDGGALVRDDLPTRPRERLEELNRLASRVRGSQSSGAESPKQ